MQGHQTIYATSHMNLRIAILGLRGIGPEAGVGGIEVAAGSIATRLAARGHEVTVFCRSRYNPPQTTVFKGVRLINLPAVYTKHMEAISHTALAAIRVMGGYDIVHFHATGPSLLSFLPRATGQKVVATVHGLDWQRDKWKGFAKSALKAGAWAAGRFPHETIVVSQHLQRFYKETYDRDAVHIPNGVTPTDRIPIDTLKRFNVSGDDYVLFLGRLVPEKGCHFLIEAFRKMNSPAKLLIVGGPSYSDNYLQYLKELTGDDARIVFTGSLYGQDKAEAYSNALTLVMPSTLEGMPLVMLEAMAHGCPVLCSDIPEHLEIVDPQQDGSNSAPHAYTFASQSIDDLKDRLTICLQTPGTRTKKADKAKAYVLDHFSWDTITDQTEAVYRSLLSSRTLNTEH